jgi:hypothetical protein
LSEGEELPAVGFDVAHGARRLTGVHVAPEDLDGLIVGIDQGPAWLQPWEGGTFVFGHNYVSRRLVETAGAG